MRRYSLLGLCLLLGLVVLAGNATHAAEAPNILLVTADDLGLQLGCYGDKAARTPHLDAFAKQACRFTNGYVAQASCSPSRSAMFTGIYPHANGQYGLLNAGVGFRLHPGLEHQTLPVLLGEAGYATAIIGKLHVGPEKEIRFQQRLRVNTRDVKAVAKEAEKFFKQSDRPFFMMANYSDPHVYGRSPRPPKEAFPTQFLGIPENPLKVGEVPSFPFQRVNDPEQIARTTQYYNAVSRLDDGFGRLLAALEESGKRDNTIIIYVSDHGPPFVRGKTTCYEAGVKVPYLIQWPGVTQENSTVDALVSTVDLLPTILDAADLKLPSKVQGISLRGMLNGDKGRDYLATEFHYHGKSPFFPRRSIRDQQFKLIHNLLAPEKQWRTSVDGDAAYQLAKSDRTVPAEVKEAFERSVSPPEFELYDLQADPWEFRNLAEDPQYKQELVRLQQLLNQWRKTTHDPLLTEQGMKDLAEYESVETDS